MISPDPKNYGTQFALSLMFMLDISLNIYVNVQVCEVWSNLHIFGYKSVLTPVQTGHQILPNYLPKRRTSERPKSLFCYVYKNR